MTRHLHAVDNPFLEVARYRKAEKIAAVVLSQLREVPRSDVITALSEDGDLRRQTLRLARIERASEDTWRLVVRLLSLGDEGGAA